MCIEPWHSCSFHSKYEFLKGIIIWFLFLVEGKSEKMATRTQNLIMSAVSLDWGSLSVTSSFFTWIQDSLLGRLWCFGKTLEVWIFWRLCPWFLEYTKHILLVFCPLSALTVPLCLVNCVKSLLKTCHSVLAQRQTDLLVPLFCWRLIHLARKFCPWCSLLCSFSAWGDHTWSQKLSRYCCSSYTPSPK